MNESPVKKPESATSSALFGVAVIQSLMTWVGWFMFGPKGLSWLAWAALTGSIGIYIVLGIAARKEPLKAACIGCGLFAGYLGYQTLQGVPLTAAFIYRIPVGGLLLIALNAAWMQRKRQNPAQKSQSDGS